jgi:hypothetical protein
MIISINDIGFSNSTDTLAAALSANRVEVLSVGIDWTQGPVSICESLELVKQNMVKKTTAEDGKVLDGKRFDGFAGTGLGAVLALRMAEPPNQRWLALDIPLNPKEYFLEAVKTRGIEISEDKAEEFANWLDTAEKHMLKRIKAFMLAPKDERNMGDSIIAMSQESQEFKTVLWDAGIQYSVIGSDSQSDQFERLVPIMF